MAGLCPLYLSGSCNRAEKCTFIHDLDQGEAPVQSAEAKKLIKAEKKRIGKLQAKKAKIGSSSSDTDTTSE